MGDFLALGDHVDALDARVVDRGLGVIGEGQLAVFHRPLAHLFTELPVDAAHFDVETGVQGAHGAHRSKASAGRGLKSFEKTGFFGGAQFAGVEHGFDVRINRGEAFDEAVVQPLDFRQLREAAINDFGAGGRGVIKDIRFDAFLHGAGVGDAVVHQGSHHLHPDLKRRARFRGDLAHHFGEQRLHLFLQDHDLRHVFARLVKFVLQAFHLHLEGRDYLLVGFRRPRGQCAGQTG